MLPPPTVGAGPVHPPANGLTMRSSGSGAGSASGPLSPGVPPLVIAATSLSILTRVSRTVQLNGPAGRELWSLWVGLWPLFTLGSGALGVVAGVAMAAVDRGNPAGRTWRVLAAAMLANLFGGFCALVNVPMA